MTKTSLIARIAVSSLVLAVTMVGASGERLAMVANASGISAASRDAMTAAGKAEKAMAKQNFTGAIMFAEAAVAGAPRDAGYRTMLGRAYLGSGRYSSAETAFADALAIDPAQGRAALMLVLVQTGLGKVDAARATIAANENVIQVADRGLALALAGQAPAAVTLLEAHVRGAAGDAKTRQNLALSYALAGRWAEARAMAAYDLSPQDADKRIMEWSTFSRPTSASDQVASLLGVGPVVDAGMPAQLALAPVGAAPVTVAEASAPTMVAEAAQPAPAPMIVQAVAQPMPAEATAVSAETVAAFKGVSFAPRSEVVQPLPAVTRTASFAPARFAATVTKAKVMKPGFKPAAFVKPKPDGKFVVQLGAFSASARVETAWNRAVGKLGALRDFSPSSATFVRATPVAATLYRLSIGGFSIRGDAVQVCERVKSAGGDCFVRAVAGDAPLQWAQKKSSVRYASN